MKTQWKTVFCHNFCDTNTNNFRGISDGSFKGNKPPEIVRNADAGSNIRYYAKGSWGYIFKDAVKDVIGFEFTINARISKILHTSFALINITLGNNLLVSHSLQGAFASIDSTPIPCTNFKIELNNWHKLTFKWSSDGGTYIYVDDVLTSFRNDTAQNKTLILTGVDILCEAKGFYSAGSDPDADHNHDGIPDMPEIIYDLNISNINLKAITKDDSLSTLCSFINIKPVKNEMDKALKNYKNIKSFQNDLSTKIDSLRMNFIGKETKNWVKPSPDDQPYKRLDSKIADRLKSMRNELALNFLRSFERIEIPLSNQSHTPLAKETAELEKIIGINILNYLGNQDEISKNSIISNFEKLLSNYKKSDPEQFKSIYNDIKNVKIEQYINRNDLAALEKIRQNYKNQFSPLEELIKLLSLVVTKVAEN